MTIFYYIVASNLIYSLFWLIVIPLTLYFATFAVKQFVKEVVIDTIELRHHWQTAKADINRRRLDDQFTEDSRRAKLAVWQRQARQQLTQQRTALQLGSAAMWKMGVFDIEIE